MYAKNIRPSVKPLVQIFRSAKRDDRIAYPIDAPKNTREARDENVPAKLADFC